MLRQQFRDLSQGLDMVRPQALKEAQLTYTIGHCC
jgi:hypothetical protein